MYFCFCVFFFIFHHSSPSSPFFFFLLSILFFFQALFKIFFIKLIALLIFWNLVIAIILMVLDMFTLLCDKIFIAQNVKMHSMFGDRFFNFYSFYFILFKLFYNHFLKSIFIYYFLFIFFSPYEPNYVVLEREHAPKPVAVPKTFYTLPDLSKINKLDTLSLVLGKEIFEVHFHPPPSLFCPSLIGKKWIFYIPTNYW